MTLRPTAREALTALALIGLFSLPINLLLGSRIPREAFTRDFVGQIARYARERDRYDLVFLGESRTVTDFDPEQLDPLLGTHSLNLGHWAHRFPTQYPSYRDLVKRLAPGTVVVWSVGYSNFAPHLPTVNFAYAIPVRLVPRYLRWGYAPTLIQDNVASGMLDVVPAHAIRDRLYDFVTAKVASVIPTAMAGGRPPLRNQATFDSLRALLLADSTIEHVNPRLDGDTITSLEVLKRRGNYTRIEIDSTYFRAHQRALAAAVRPLTGAFESEAPYWNTFEGILELFRSRHVRLIVNELSQAPAIEAVGDNAARHREFMDHVHAVVEARGIPYVRVAWESFADADYFDAYHLNSRGLARFMPMFADSLRRRLR
jgi:hypothetical protein